MSVCYLMHYHDFSLARIADQSRYASLMAQQPRLINYCISSCINGSDLVMRRIIICTPIIYRHRNTMIPVNRRIYHPQSGVVMFSMAVRMYVCLYVCNRIAFESLDVERSFFDNPAPLESMRVKFVDKSHRIKVKVTGAKYGNPYSRSVPLR